MTPVMRLGLLLTGVLLLSGSALGQRRYVVSNVTLPFSFLAGGTEYPAGEYVLDSSQPGFITIHAKQGNIHGDIPVSLYGEPVKRTDARLIFVNRNGHYVLRELWGVLGKYVTTSEYGHEGSKDEETKEIRLTYPG